MIYLLDTNILIHAKNYMPIDIHVSFWNKLRELANTGLICSSEKVRDEINRGNDDLTAWCKDNLQDAFFLPLDKDDMTKYAAVIQWASNNRVFTQAAVQEFASVNVADAFLVATAAAKHFTLVTEEKPDPKCKQRVKIPDACIALDVGFCSLNDVLHALKVTI